MQNRKFIAGPEGRGGILLVTKKMLERDGFPKKKVYQGEGIKHVKEMERMVGKEV